MKPMSLNLSKMKKIAGDQHSSTFLHPSGHKMVISHKGISALQRKQLEQMPVQKMADGGDAQAQPQGDSEGETLGSAIGYPGSSKPKDTKGTKPKMMADGGDALPPELADLPQDPSTAPPTDNSAPPIWDSSDNGGVAKTLGQDVRQGVGDAAQAFKNVGSAVLGPVGDFAKGLLSVPDAHANIPASAEESAEGKPPAMETEEQLNAGAPTPTQKGAPASDAIPPASSNFVQAFDQGQRAINEQQQVNVAKAKADADVQSQDLLNRQSLNQSVQDHFQTYQQHAQDVIKDIASDQGHINPNHYFENMSTPERVTSAIGLLLGGLTGGVSGRNPAMDFINQQVNRDIEGQKSRINQQKTLLGANRQVYQDQQVADNQTRVNMNDIYDRQIQLAASKLGTPQAKASADAAHAQFTMQNAALLQQNAIRSAVLGHLRQGGQGLNATDLARAGIIPQQDAEKEQTSIDSQRKALASAQEIFKGYDQEQTPGNLANYQSYGRANALNAQLTNLIMESDASKRLTPESAKIEVQPFWVKTTDDAATRQSKLRGIGELIRQHAAPTPYMSRYAPRSVPQYDQSSAGASPPGLEGKTAVNPKTGQRIVMKNGRWVPLGG